MYQGTGQPERLHCTSPCQCSWPPGHCRLQIDWSPWPAKVRCLNSGAEGFVFKSGIVSVVVIEIYY